MGLLDEITDAVTAVLSTPWNIRNGLVVPATENVALKDGAVLLDAVYLYADMANSTGLAKDFTRETAAKVIRAYLDASCRVIRSEGGEIRSFDGDRVMAIYVGDTKNTTAARTGLKINYVVTKIVRPAVEKKFPALVTKGFGLTHCVGVANGQALLVRGGVRNNNDLVSVGRAPNVAAKLSEVRNGDYRTYITGDVYKVMLDFAKYGSSNKKPMWEERQREVGGETITVYRSNWTWTV